jgi:hypothetical protein
MEGKTGRASLSKLKHAHMFGKCSNCHKPFGGILNCVYICSGLPGADLDSKIDCAE